MKTQNLKDLLKEKENTLNYIQLEYNSKRAKKRKDIELDGLERAKIIESLIKERGYFCEKCKIPLSETQNNPRQRQLHHKKKMYDGGGYSEDNLQLLCRSCHINLHQTERAVLSAEISILKQALEVIENENKLNDDLINSAYLECQRLREALQNERKEILEKNKLIIKRELGYWQDAYPKQKELLRKFAEKIYFEQQLNSEKTNE